MHLRQITTLFVVISLLFSSFASAQAQEFPGHAKAAILIEASTGKVLYGFNENERRAPASTTKMMTTILALENGNFDDIVTTSDKAATTGGSSIWLMPGEQLTLEQMLYGIMLESGCDASTAVAEHIAGSEEAFVEMMNQKARALGATNTHFMNPHGLDAEGHYSTAADLAKIARYGLLSVPHFAEIVSTEEKVIPWPGHEWQRALYNTNKLLWYYEGTNGVKTGYTDNAGQCLVSSATRNGMQLIAVVLGSDDIWSDSIQLLDYGFQNYQPYIIFQKNAQIKTVKVRYGVEDSIALIPAYPVTIPVQGDDGEKIRVVYDVPRTVSAPVETGQKIGVAKIMLDNQELTQVNLLAEKKVERKSFWAILFGPVWNLFTLVAKNFT